MKTSKDTTEKTTKKYWAFISYRHADNLEQDRDWASWLHKSIETYDVPAELIGTKNDRGDIIPERIYPVFRDEESLPADADLANSITNALDSSNFLVALCSPRAVESKYVAQEIEHFKATGKGNRIIAAIIAGEPGHPENECFPVPILEVVNQDGKLSEPIAADFRLLNGEEGYTSAEAYKKELLKNLPKKESTKKAVKYDERLQLMKLKIIAGILAVPLETIRDRDKAYQLQKAKKRQKILTVVISTVSLLSIASIIATFFAINQKKIADQNTQKAIQSQREAETSRAIALESAKAEQLAKREAEKNAKSEKQAKVIAEKQRDIASKEKQRADQEAKEAKYQAYKSQLKMAADLVGKQHIAEARRLLFEVDSSIRGWEWAYLISRCGATPKGLNELKPDALWLTNDLILELKKRLSEAPKADLDQNLTLLKKRILAGERICLHSGSWRGGGHAIVFQGNTPTPQFSFWCGMYADPQKTVFSADSSAIIWSCAYGEMGGRIANLWSGDMILKEHSIAPIPTRIGVLTKAVALKNNQLQTNRTKDLLHPAHLLYGPHTFGPQEKRLQFDDNLSIKSTGEVQLITERTDESGNTDWKLTKWNLKKAPKLISQSVYSRKWADDSTGVSSIPKINDIEIADFQLAMKKRKISRKFCCWVTVNNKHYALLEGDGLELWDTSKVKLTKKVCSPSLLKVSQKDSMGVSCWLNDACPVGENSIAGWLPNANGQRVLAIGNLKDGKAHTMLLKKSGQIITEEEEFAYSVHTEMLASPLGNQITLSLVGRNEQDFMVWNARTGALALETSYEIPQGVGWAPDERFLAIVNNNGHLALYEKFGGKLIRNYKGIIIDSHHNMPVRYSPDGKRILISNLLIDSTTLDPLLILPPSTIVSQDWDTVITWIDETTFEISSTAFWKAYQNKKMTRNLLTRDLLLLNEIANKDAIHLKKNPDHSAEF